MNIEVETRSFPVPRGLTVRAPEGSLHQVLYNLTANAMEASPRGGVVSVVAALADDDRAIITVSDQGAGTTADARDRIFEPFYSSKTGDDPTDGPGLGLSIVNNTVDSVGGSVDFQSQPDKGTCFCVRLPISATSNG